ncbi:unnamed protein product [Caenorhabditis auriculariae]|uniref:Uncharacterized protein n=1 Tax=Caenorhabditis auriculariae TaxID=2777116 RepID=A0A8S1HLF0_9PELO|nr:unnamed protein product [Caenorhabditis auriculariae]
MQVQRYTSFDAYNRQIDHAKQLPRLSNLQAPIMLCNGHGGEIFTAQFSPDGSCFATAGYDNQIFLWNVYGDCENFAVLKGHTGSVMDLKFNTDSRLIFSAGTEHGVRVWDMETGACVRNAKAHKDIVNSVHPCRRGPQLFVSAGDDKLALVHDIRQKFPVKKYENKFPQTAVTFNDTSDQIFVGGIDNTIKAWDLRKDQIEYVLRGHNDTITDLVLSPDGRFILSNSMDCALKQWDVRPFTPSPSRLVNSFFGHQHNFEKNLLKCAWSPDGTRIASGSSDRYVYAWETASRRILYKLPGHHGSVNAVDFHPTEPILLSAGSDKRIFLGEIA